MDNRVPSFRSRQGQAPSASSQPAVGPVQSPQPASNQRIKEIPGYEDHARRASGDPAMHVVSLLEDAKWFTPGITIVSSFAMLLATGVVAGILAGIIDAIVLSHLGQGARLFLFGAIAFLIWLPLAILGFAWFVFGRGPTWFQRPFGGNKPVAGSGVAGHTKARLFGYSLIILATIVTGGAFLVPYLIWRLLDDWPRGGIKRLHRKVTGSEKFYARERDIEI